MKLFTVKQAAELSENTDRLLLAHLLILLNRLLLGLGDDALQFVEASFHIGEAQSSVLLLPADALQLLLPVLLGNAGTLLPLLDTLGEDLIDPAVDQKVNAFHCSNLNSIRISLYDFNFGR